MSITDGAAIRALRVGVLAILLRAAAATVSLPSCPKTCGNISIPYPFGIGTGCFREGFNLTCSNSSDPPKLTLGDGTIQVLSISLPEGVVRINNNRFTFFASSNVPRASQTGLMNNGPYTFSVTRNHLVAVGCNVLASIIDPADNQLLCFCGSMCRNGSTNYGAYGGPCTGIGCCQTSISTGIKNFNVQLQSSNQSTPIWAIGMSSMAFLVEQNSYHFSPDDLRSSRHVWESRVIPAVLDWTIRENSNNLSKFACRSNNSERYNSADRAGYRCNCSQGFHGNPYVIGGCEETLFRVKKLTAPPLLLHRRCCTPPTTSSTTTPSSTHQSSFPNLHSASRPARPPPGRASSPPYTAPPPMTSSLHGCRTSASSSYHHSSDLTFDIAMPRDISAPSKHPATAISAEMGTKVMASGLHPWWSAGVGGPSGGEARYGGRGWPSGEGGRGLMIVAGAGRSALAERGWSQKEMLRDFGRGA